MNRPTPTVTLRVLAAVLGLGLAAFAIVSVGAAGSASDMRLEGTGSAGPDAAGPSPAALSAAARFSITGQVSGLYPGRTAPLVLTVTNPLKFEIFVVSLSTTVGTASPGCAAGNLAVSSFSGHAGVPANGSATIAVSVTMTHSAPDGCQGVTFPLHYSGLATRS
jgi:hypothetical protein